MPMRRLLHMLLLFSLLFANLEGAIDIAKAGHPHDDPVMQLAAVSDAAVHDLDANQDGDAPCLQDHCEHCCHGHTSVLIAIAALLHTGCRAATHGPYADTSLLNFAPAPPTPPPNA